MPKLICLDTQILIWGVQGVASAGQEDMIDRAKQLLQQFIKEKTQILIPTIVLSEFLIGMTEDTQEVIRRLVSRGFQIVPYDTAAALQFARIWNTNVTPSVKTEVFQGTRPSRHELKADICILATAVTRQAEGIYSADRRHMQRFAQGFMTVYDLRAISPFGPLFDLASPATVDDPATDTTTQE